MFRRLFGKQAPTFTVFVMDGDRQIDLYPIAAEVIEKMPTDCGMDALRLAELARISWNGTYIRVGEYPLHVDREVAKQAVGRVVSWGRWLRKEDGYRRLHRCKFKVHTGHDPCDRMKTLSGTVIKASQTNRLPLDDCWRHCQCWYGMEITR